MKKLLTYYSQASYNPKNPIKGVGVSIDEYFRGVLSGRWQDVIFKWRAIQNEIERKKQKRFMLPCVTASGEFSGRNDSDLKTHSGLLCIDIDSKDNDVPMDEIRTLLKEIPEIVAIHYSVSGNGLAVYFKISINKHSQSFEAIAKMLVNDYGIIPDMSCSNISRLRFVSYDPSLHLNYGADTWKTFLPKPKKSEITVKKLHNHIHSGADIDYVIDQISNRRLDIAVDYYAWLRIAFAFADELGEGGRNHFLLISNMYNGKQKINPDKQFTNCLRRGKSGITIATFFYYAQQAGCAITSKRTATISTIGKLRRKQENSKNGGIKDGRKDAIEYLKNSEDIEGADVDEILDQVWQLPSDSLKESTSNNTLLDDLEAYLKSNWDFKLNAITGAVEVDGKQMEDKTLNDIYISSIRIVDENIKKSLVADLIHSSFSEEYNPIKDFINENKDLNPKGNLKKLAKCIISPVSLQDDTFIYDFLEKWMISIIGSVYGTHSVMKLMLTGREMGLGKSKFFQHLLPKELNSFFSSDPMSDKQQELAMLMTQNLILLDDENRSSQKKGMEMFKAVSDKSEFKVRLPYGRYTQTLPRLAVLCGTSNNEAVIDDDDNRRIIPINVTDIDLKSFYAIDKKDLFIECFHLWDSGKEYFINREDKERLNSLTSEAFEISLELELLSRFFCSCEANAVGGEHLTATDVSIFLENKTGKKNISSRKLSKIMKDNGYLKTLKASKSNSNRIWGFWCKQVDDNDNTDKDVPF